MRTRHWKQSIWYTFIQADMRIDELILLINVWMYEVDVSSNNVNVHLYFNWRASLLVGSIARWSIALLSWIYSVLQFLQQFSSKLMIPGSCSDFHEPFKILNETLKLLISGIYIFSPQDLQWDRILWSTVQTFYKPGNNKKLNLPQ